jgi:flagellar operon protein
MKAKGGAGMTNNRVHIPYIPTPLEKTGRAAPKPAVKKREAQESFAGILEKTRSQQGLTFSSHALRRLQARRIELGPEELGKLEQAVEKAAAKGCRSSLLLYRDMAFIAGVANRTIITALDGESIKEHIFTNIDSTVVLE